jgi:hypothetical protein
LRRCFNGSRIVSICGELKEDFWIEVWVVSFPFLYSLCSFVCRGRSRARLASGPARTHAQGMPRSGHTKPRRACDPRPARALGSGHLAARRVWSTGGGQGVSGDITGVRAASCRLQSSPEALTEAHQEQHSVEQQPGTGQSSGRQHTVQHCASVVASTLQQPRISSHKCGKKSFVFALVCMSLSAVRNGFLICLFHQ